MVENGMRYQEREATINVTAKSVLLWLLDIALWLILLPSRLIRRAYLTSDDKAMFWKLPVIYLTIVIVLTLIAAAIKS